MKYICERNGADFETQIVPILSVFNAIIWCRS